MSQVKVDGFLVPKKAMKKEDGPTVPWTVADLFKSKGNKAFLAYHVMGSGWDVLTPIGLAAGGLAYGLGYRTIPYVLPSSSSISSTPTLWGNNVPSGLLPMLGTSSLLFGCAGIWLGLNGMYNVAHRPETSSIPWTPLGLQERANELGENFNVRVLDLSAWMGVGVAAGALAYAGGPDKLGFSSGTLGIVQAVSVGSSLGSITAFACRAATKRVEEKKLKKDYEL